MDAKLILLIVLAAVTLYVLMPPAKIQEKTEKYETQDPSFSSRSGNEVVVTPDELDAVIRATQQALSKKLGKYTYCIETTSITLTNNVYSGRFLFTVIPGQGGGAYGVGVDATIDKGAKYNVTSLVLQSTKTIDAMDPYGQFRTGSEIEEGNLPTASDLESALSRI
jgi:hypothetical protein